MSELHKTIFISRPLNANSPFYKRLLAEQYPIISASLIDFAPCDFNQIPSADVFFFYSKKGVEFALQNQKIRTLLSQKELAVMGQGTAALVRLKGFKIAFTGTGDPIETAKQLDAFLKQRSILFLRANNSKQSVQQLLSNQKKVSDLVIYTNQIKEQIDIPSSDILIFTSPLNAQAYFNKYAQEEHQKVIAIGNTTAQALHDLGANRVIIATKPSENALVDAVLGLS